MKTKQVKDLTVLDKCVTTETHLEMGDAERALAEYLGVDLTASPDVLVGRAKESLNRALTADLEMGLQLLAAKDKTEHGEFGELLAAHGIGTRSAQRNMQWARAFSAEGDARRRDALLAMGKTKAVLLLSAKPEAREQIMGSPELLTEALEGSKRELEATLKEHAEKLQRHEEAYADLEAQLEVKTHELRRATKVQGYSLVTQNIRAEAMADAAATQHCCDDLARLWHSAVEDEAPTHAERDLRIRAVAMAVSASFAHLMTIYEVIKADMGDRMPLVPDALDDLTDDERAAAIYSAERCQQQLVMRRAQRKSEAYADHVADGGQKKRGRPEGAKTKKAGK